MDVVRPWASLNHQINLPYCAVNINSGRPEAGHKNAWANGFWPGIALADSPESHKFWFLVGEPELESHKRAAVKAMNLIHKIGAGKVEFVRESEKQTFAEQLAEEMRKHG